jgi:hypothetical protein
LQINCEKKHNIIQHTKTAGHHERLKKLSSQNIRQQTIKESIATSSSDEQKTFYSDLCNAMISSNIPLKKLDNGEFKCFLEKYCSRHIPSESTLRKNYVDSLHEEVMDELKSTISNNFIWFSVDETTDVCGRYIANLIIGILHEESPTKAFLIASKELEKTNSNTVTKFVHDELTKCFLPNPVPSEKILLMVSDAAAYMIKAASNLKIFYTNLIHCTCLAHGLNRVAETIRLQFPLVNTLISQGKKIFLKAPLRVQIFKEKMPGIPLPPQPVLTRWGTWLDAAMYYADNFEGFKEVVLDFSESTSQSIKDCQTVLKNQEIKQNLAFLKANYKFVSTTIKKLESTGLTLVEAVEIINNFQIAVSRVPGRVGKIVTTKLNEVLSKNTGYKVLENISNIFKGDIVENFEVEVSLVAKFKYAPLTSVDVERSFSHFKNLLSDRRRSFSVQNIEKHLIIACYKNKSEV